MTGKLPENLPKNYPIYSKTLPQWLQTQQNLPKAHPSSTSNFGLWWETSVPFAGLEELKNMNAPGSFPDSKRSLHHPCLEPLLR